MAETKRQHIVSGSLTRRNRSVPLHPRRGGVGDGIDASIVLMGSAVMVAPFWATFIGAATQSKSSLFI